MAAVVVVLGLVGAARRSDDTSTVETGDAGYKTQYLSVIIGGMIAGLGGAYFIFGSTGRFDENMTNGRGYIALAAMIFGRWNPVGAFLVVAGFAGGTTAPAQGSGFGPLPRSVS